MEGTEELARKRSEVIAAIASAILVLCGTIDVLLVERAYAQPKEEWSKTFGGSAWDDGHSVWQTKDGGYIIAGSTHSFGAGGWDFYLVKADPAGNMVWNRTYGGNNKDDGCSVQQTSDRGYIIAGNTRSFGVFFENIWVIKTDKSGNMQWNNTYGWNGTDIGYSVQQTSDEGYIIVGSTESYGEGKSDICW